MQLELWVCLTWFHLVLPLSAECHPWSSPLHSLSLYVAGIWRQQLWRAKANRAEWLCHAEPIKTLGPASHWLTERQRAGANFIADVTLSRVCGVGKCFCVLCENGRHKTSTLSSSFFFSLHIEASGDLNEVGISECYWRENSWTCVDWTHIHTMDTCAQPHMCIIWYVTCMLWLTEQGSCVIWQGPVLTCSSRVVSIHHPGCLSFWRCSRSGFIVFQ